MWQHTGARWAAQQRHHSGTAAAPRQHQAGDAPHRAGRRCTQVQAAGKQRAAAPSRMLGSGCSRLSTAGAPTPHSCLSFHQLQPGHAAFHCQLICTIQLHAGAQLPGCQRRHPHHDRGASRAPLCLEQELAPGAAAAVGVGSSRCTRGQMRCGGATSSLRGSKRSPTCRRECQAGGGLGWAGLGRKAGRQAGSGPAAAPTRPAAVGCRSGCRPPSLAPTTLHSPVQ